MPRFPEAVTRLGAPPPFRCGKVDAVFAARSPEARRWVNSGLAALYAESGFEALRCFYRAVMAEPECARAWWGVALSIQGRHHEWAALRAAAAERAGNAAAGAQDAGLNQREKQPKSPDKQVITGEVFGVSNLSWIL